MNVQAITTRDPRYQEELALRVEVLCKPAGLTLEDVIFPYEDESLHLVAIRDGAIIGCVLFHPEAESGRLYQMAVAVAHQRQGVGNALLQTLEQRLISMGIASMYLHARPAAIPFYVKNGFCLEGKPFDEVGIPHRQMRKTFS